MTTLAGFAVKTMSLTMKKGSYTTIGALVMLTVNVDITREQYNHACHTVSHDTVNKIATTLLASTVISNLFCYFIKS